MKLDKRPTCADKLVFPFYHWLQRTVNWSILCIYLIWRHRIILLLVLRFLSSSRRCLFGHHIIYDRVFELLLGKTTFYAFVCRLHKISSWSSILTYWKSSRHIRSRFLLEIVVWRLIKVAGRIIVILTVILWIVKRLIISPWSTYCII